MIEQGCWGATGPEDSFFRRLSRNPRDPGCILEYTFSLNGALDAARLEHALRATVVDHFPELLYVFEECDGRVLKRRRPLPGSFLDIFQEDIDWLEFGGDAEASLPEGKVFRFLLVRVAPAFQYLRLSFSHLAFDGGCYALFVSRLEQAYAAPSMTQALSGARSVSPWTETVASSTDTEYWASALSGRKLGQPLRFLGGLDPSCTRFITVRRTVCGNAFEALRDMIATEKTTLFRTIVASLAVLIFRYDRDEHADGLAIAHTVNTRAAVDGFGNFANVVPLFVPDRPEWTPRNYFDHIREERRRARPHQRCPLTRLVELADEQANRNTRILNLIVNESQGLLPRIAPAFDGLEVALVRTPATGGPFDLGVTFAHDADSLRLSIDVPEELASRALVVGFADNLVAALAHFAAQPDAPVSTLDLSRAPSPVACGRTLDLDGEDSLLTRIFMRAQEAPDEIAISFGARTLSYAEITLEIAALASRIASSADAHRLRAGVGISLSRNERLPVAMLAVLALGVPFVPLERSLPVDRLRHILATAEVEVVVSDDAARDELFACRPDLVFVPIDGPVHADDKRIASIPQAAPPDTASDVAYVLFTSGSTGLPKGVAITRRNLFNFLLSMADDPGFQARDRFLALTPTSFDISILELLLPLFVGAQMRIVDDTTRRSAVDLAGEIERSGVNVVQATPATWRMLKAVGWSSARPLTVLCGGEALTREIADYLLVQGHRLYNMYGPTEATIWASCAPVRKGQPIHLGVPVLNTQFHIVDERLRPVADGQAGELLIVGECVGAGYLGPHSGGFMEVDDSRRGYRTGDIVRSLGDGRLLYVGRRDNQRKINGHRIELDEISLRLRALVGEADVFTVVRERPAPYLCSFYRAHPDAEIDVAKVLDAAKRSLPSYMLPSMLVRLDALPLTPNGKVDLGYLSTCPLPESAQPAGHGIERESQPATGTGTVAALRALLVRTLDVDIDDPTASLGWLGLNSISFSQLSLAIATEFGARVPPHRFYTLKTLASLAGEIDAQQGLSTPERDATRGHDAISAPERTNRAEGTNARAIAIVGYSVGMPGGLEADAFWEALMQCDNLVVARSRPGFRAPLHAGFIDGIDEFDARFFSISPLEANYMDPRQRLLLQSAWRAIEDAGYAAATLSGQRIGCYIAATGCDYATLQARAGSAFSPYTLPGTSLSILANRISSFFNWTGPSSTIDTACSGALSALVRACNDLAAGVCAAALVGGVNVIADDQISYGLDAGNFMSPRYRCATFDEQADGYVRGEGYGCFLLKPLASAIADGDAIHGVIEGFAENHGGRSTSLTAPNPEAQAQLIVSAYTAELAREVGYIETHGTGTRLGDPIEIDALKAAGSRIGWQQDGRKIWLGAAKSNIGHLEPAAGIASLAKVLLAMRHGVLPSNLHFRRLNPLIELEGSPFAILDAARPWLEQDVGRRVAGISSFGFGGSNAHVVVASPPARASQVASPTHVLVTLSAKTRSAFTAMADALHTHMLMQLERDEVFDLEALAYTLNAGRTHFEYRAAWIIGSPRELVERLACDVSMVRILPREERVTEAPPVTLLDRLDRLRQAYLHGEDIDWSDIHPGSPRRMHLPTYRFDLQQYWFDRGRTAPAHRKEAKAAEDALP
jgi:amino acid adenylation domain-containing protein